jgi:hypothetical protein
MVAGVDAEDEQDAVVRGWLERFHGSATVMALEDEPGSLGG